MHHPRVHNARAASVPRFHARIGLFRARIDLVKKGFSVVMVTFGQQFEACYRVSFAHYLVPVFFVDQKSHGGSRSNHRFLTALL